MRRRSRIVMELVAALANLAPAHRALLVDADDGVRDEEDDGSG